MHLRKFMDMDKDDKARKNLLVRIVFLFIFLVVAVTANVYLAPERSCMFSCDAKEKLKLNSE